MNHLAADIFDAMLLRIIVFRNKTNLKSEVISNVCMNAYVLIHYYISYFCELCTHLGKKPRHEIRTSNYGIGS